MGVERRRQQGEVVIDPHHSLPLVLHHVTDYKAQSSLMEFRVPGIRIIKLGINIGDE